MVKSVGVSDFPKEKNMLQKQNESQPQEPHLEKNILKKAMSEKNIEEK